MSCLSKSRTVKCLQLFARSCGFAGGALMLAACGRHPDIVESAADVWNLSVKEHSIRARGLPDPAIHSLGRLRSLKRIDFGSGHGVKRARITDRGLAILSGLRLEKLESLNLSYNDNITNAGLEDVGELRTLRTLVLADCPNITDDGLAAIAGLRKLHSLNLMGCDSITDEGLTALIPLRGLRHLYLDGCEGISTEGVERLQRRMRSTVVSKDDEAWAYLNRHR